MAPKSHVPAFFAKRHDAEFTKKLTKLAIPMILQQFMSAVVGIFDVVFIGGLGDKFLSGAGQANNVTMLMWCGLFAVGSSGSIFAAQYWGKNKDLNGVRRAFSATLIFGLIVSIAFWALGFFAGEPIMMLLSKDSGAREVGVLYLRILAFAYPLWGVSSMFSSMLRSIGVTRIPMISSIVAICINIAMDSVLVFGFLGFPRLGVTAAAMSTVVGAGVELILNIVLTAAKKVPLRMSKENYAKPDRDLTKKMVKTAIPLLAKDQLWAAGVMVYSICFSSIGLAESAAYNAYATLQEIMNVFFNAVGAAGGILIGHVLGAGDIEKAKNYAWRLLHIVLLSGLILGPIFIFLRKFMLMPFFELSAEALDFASIALFMSAITIWAKSINATTMNGILRAGGDTFGAASIDIGMLWVFGVPLALVVTYVFHLPFAYMFGVMIAEESIKTIFSFIRIRTYKWAKKLV